MHRMSTFKCKLLQLSPHQRGLQVVLGYFATTVIILYSLLYLPHSILIFTVVILGLSAKLCLSIFIPPATFPRNIPTVPFYVTLRPLVLTTDQAETFEQYFRPALHTVGAANLFFGSRWNVLVSRPSYLHQLFKDEDTFAKSGNQEKIPYSVLAGYTGENVISATGEKWRCYRSVIQPGLERRFDDTVVKANAKTLVRLLLEAQSQMGKNGVQVQGMMQRYSMENLGKELLGVDFKTLDNPASSLHKLQLSVKLEIFKPFFLNFPIFDKLPIPSRNRARDLSKQFADALINTLQQLRVSNTDCRRIHNNISQDDSTSPQKSTAGILGSLLLAAKESRIWTHQQLRHNMIAVFLAGHENPQLNLTSALYLLGKHPETQERLRKEIMDDVRESDHGTDTTDLLSTLPYLSAVTLEILRMYPPISQLINRRVTRDVLLGGMIPLREGTYVGYNCYSTHRDPEAWGLDAWEFKPERWGSTIEDIKEEYRRRKSRAEFVAFHGGRRACLGEKYALMHFKATIYELIKSVKWILDETWDERMMPAGPLYPMALRIRFEKLGNQVEC